MPLHILGRLDLTSKGDGSSTNVTKQTRLLLACLALAGSKGLTRVEICELFWPDRPPALARNSLRQALVAIKNAVRHDGDAISVQSDLEIVKLSAQPEAIDIHAFRQGIFEDKRDTLIMAADSFGGEVLAGVEMPDHVEQFVTSHRRSISDQAAQLSERLSKADDGDELSLNAAQAIADRLLQSDPSCEEAHRALIRIHLRRGKTNAALRQFEHCKEALQRELQTAPDIETKRLFDAIQPSASDDRTKAAEGPAAKRTGPIPSIAIMPFDNLGAASDAYFADGVVEEIGSTLSRIRDFFVISRQSTLTFKGQFVDAREVGRTLGVAYLVEGTVRRDGDRLRISVQLVDAITLTQLWSDRYEGANTEIFAYQDRIAAQVAGALNPAIRRAEIDAALRKPPVSLQAYDLVMRAFPKLWGQNGPSINQAISILHAALEIDPKYGRAYALLAWCHALNATYLWTQKPDRDVTAARQALDGTAGRIDDDPTALTAAGAAIGFCGDHEDASALLERALALDPNNAWAWARWGWTGIYRAQPQAALERFEQAMKLSPLDPFAFNTRIGMASALACLGNPAEAVTIAKDVTKKHPDVTWAHRLLASWAAMAGDMEAARAAARKLLAASPDFTIQRYLAIPGFLNMPEYRDRLVQGLRDAGLPEA